MQTTAVTFKKYTLINDDINKLYGTHYSYYNKKDVQRLNLDDCFYGREEEIKSLKEDVACEMVYHQSLDYK